MIFFDNKENVLSNQTLIDLALLRINQMGITWEEIIDWDSVIETLLYSLSPLITAFIPTAISILLIGGKRSVELNFQVTYNLKVICPQSF